MPDDISLECYECTSKFTSFRRRHHCRVCGQVFCSKCCSSYIPGKHIAAGHTGNIRVCTYCYKFYQTVTQQGAQSQNPENQENDEDDILSSSPNINRRRPSIDQVAQLSNPQLSSPSTYRRKISSTAAIYAREDLANTEETQSGVNASQEIIRLKEDTLQRLWTGALDSDHGLKLETHRYYFRSYPGTFQGCKLVDWLMSSKLVDWVTGQDEESSISTSQAIDIGQALLTAGMMSSVSGSVRFSGGSDLYIPVHNIDSSEECKDEPDSAVVGGNSAVLEPAWLQDLPNYSVFEEPPEIKEDSQVLKNEQKVSVSSVPEVDLGDLKVSVVLNPQENLDKSQLDSVYMKHENNYLDLLLKDQNIPSTWKETIIKLADTAVKTVKPNVRYKGDEMDILAYVKVKCVAGGDISECRLVEGEVCSLQLTHKNMSSNIVKPRIALVSESIMFKDRNTMVSLETVSLQEAEYVKNVIGKLLDLKPSLILVEKSVAHLAQEILLREGVSLAVNVKRKVLTRLSRLTQASIIQSVDTLISTPRLGTCGHVTSEIGKNLGKTKESRLLAFEGCNPVLGGTVLIRGGDRRFLSKVKSVLKRLILIKYNWKHERSLLADEYAATQQECENGYNDDFDQHQLSISPFIKIGKDIENKSLDVTEVAEEVTDDNIDPGNGDENANVDEEQNVTKHPWCESFINQKITNLSDSKLRDKQALFRAAGWRQHHITKNKLKVEPKFPVILPGDHTEVLHVQLSMFSKQSRVFPNYCVPPWVVDMELYSANDMCLGEFLDSFCFSPDYVCPEKDCATPILQVYHTRRFCHAGGAVTLQMQSLEAPIMNEEEDADKLMMWKYCKTCEMRTNIVPVSDNTWSLSFSMFLQLLLHEKSLVRRGASRPDAVCSCSLHQEQITCFGKGAQVATFRYSKLQVYDIITPGAQLEMPKIFFSREKLTQKLLECKEASSMVFSSVLTKLHSSFDSGYEIDQEKEHRSYRERLEKLEEAIKEANGDGSETMSLLKLFQRDIMLSQLSWTRRLSLIQDTQRSSKKSSTVTSSTESTESDTTVKTIMSKILPQSDDTHIPHPFSPDVHLITHVGGVELDFPSTCFVHEAEPSSLISYLLSSPSYQHFLSSSDRDTKHFKLEMSDGSTKFYCCSYFTAEFHQLRKLILQDEILFIQSLSECSRWEAMGGKSGLSFYKTTDDRFVLKQLSRFEYQSFLDVFPQYCQYLQQSIESGQKTLLGKIVGVYQVGFKNSTTGTGMRMEFLIMENLFYNKNVSKSYDLKGSVRNRLIPENDGQEGTVLLDENLLRVSCESPLYVNQLDKDLLMNAIRRDSAFLTSQHMMDYSLLVGICDEDNSLVVGIIDYIRQYDWNKKIETMVKEIKSSGVFGGQAKTPTVIPPSRYKGRFEEAMNRYFSVVQ